MSTKIVTQIPLNTEKFCPIRLPTQGVTCTGKMISTEFANEDWHCLPHPCTMGWRAHRCLPRTGNRSLRPSFRCGLSVCCTARFRRALKLEFAPAQLYTLLKHLSTSEITSAKSRVMKSPTKASGEWVNPPPWSQMFMIYFYHTWRAHRDIRNHKFVVHTRLCLLCIM